MKRREAVSRSMLLLRGTNKTALTQVPFLDEDDDHCCIDRLSVHRHL